MWYAEKTVLDCDFAGTQMSRIVGNENIKKVCIIRLGGFGDIVFFAHALRNRTRRTFPGAKIDFIVAREFVSLLDGCDFVDRVIGHDRIGGLTGLVPFLKFCSMLRAEKYDLLIDLHNTTRSRLIGTLARPRRRTFVFPSQEDSPLPDAHSEAPPQYPGIEFPGDRTPLWLSPADREFISSLGKDLGRPAIGLCLVGSWKTKRWPAGHFAALGNALIKNMGAAIVLIGGPSDAADAETVEKCLPGGKVINLAGKTTLSRSVAVTLMCSAVVSNDSGMLHAAFLSGVPLIGLFGCTDHTAFGHTGPRSVTLTAALQCSPCHKPVCPLGTVECMTALSPDRVFSALEELL
jgi:heptosyltransferase-2